MSSLDDLHSTKEEMSVTIPLSSMETTLTGMATVRPVSTAVLMISVSWSQENWVQQEKKNKQVHLEFTAAEIRVWRQG